MISKVVCVAIIFAVTAARPQDGHHDHAFSSQSIVLHTDGHDHHQGHHEDHELHHGHEEVHHHEHKIEHPTHHHKHEHEHKESYNEHHEIEHNYHESHNEYKAEQPIKHEEFKHYEVYEAPAHHEGKDVHKEPEHKEQHEEHYVDYYAHPKYSFDYEVKDSHTGDYKSQHEVRDGDVVHGFYSFHEADGTTRIVEYSADKHKGFTATVKNEGHPHVMDKEHH